MIVNFFLNLIYFIIDGFFSLFPTATLSDSIASSVTTASGYLSAVNVVVPVTTIIIIIGLILTIEGIFLTIKIINWFIRKIPTIN